MNPRPKGKIEMATLKMEMAFIEALEAGESPWEILDYLEFIATRKMGHRHPTATETLKFIEHEVSGRLENANIDWRRYKTCPSISISAGGPRRYVMPCLYSPALDNYIEGVFRQIGIIPARDSLSGRLYLTGEAVDNFGKTHKAEISAFLGKSLESETEDEPAESFGGPLEGPQGKGAGL
jgi:hypothetical protein